ncbi:MAG: hypothetical protein MUE44_21360 [Oscillatoriaceae cyanobacterium Prado104]|jgi:hypothetical protein|nr:hypothetical protein [Oscillatoriaceae cyanobacterium Prado104]
MANRSGCSQQPSQNLSIAKKSVSSTRRIELLKEVASGIGLTYDDARPFGKLTKTSTWEALLESKGIDTRSLYPSKSPDKTDISIESTDAKAAAAGFISWVDPLQLMACFFASVGLFVLLCQVISNPLTLLPPVRVTIQVGGSQP